MEKDLNKTLTDKLEKLQKDFDSLKKQVDLNNKNNTKNQVNIIPLLKIDTIIPNRFITNAGVQPQTTGTTTGFTAGSGTAIKDDATFTGNLGTTAYTIGDVVLALKQLGIMKQ